jgi:agmatinase
MDFPRFGEIPEESSSYEQSHAVILPVPYEHTTSYLRGTAAGPEAILRASLEIELFDEKLVREVYRDIGLHTLPAITIDCPIEQFLGILETEVARHVRNNKLVVTLGGEHTVTLAAVQAVAKSCPGLSVLQIDAHADLRNSYRGYQYSHATVMRRILDHASLYQVGIRSLTREEFSLIDGERVSTLFSHDISTERIDAFVAELPEDLYLTIDMDGFDPAVVPGVGNPEPGGITWKTADYLLEQVSRSCSIRAFDVVELRPLPGEVRSEITAARLIYRLLGYIAREREH